MAKPTSVKMPIQEEAEEEFEETEEEMEEEAAEEPKPQKQQVKKEILSAGEWSVQDIPTQTTPMIINLKEGKAYTVEIALTKILNKLDRIEKSVLG